MRFGGFFIVLFSVFFTLLIFEGAFLLIDTTGLFPRFFQKIKLVNPKFDREGTGKYYAHPYSSYDLVPGSSGRDLSYVGPTIVNSHGFRGGTIANPKPSKTYRIFALGSSTTYGIRNDENETYPYFLENELNTRLNTDNVEVVNAGLMSATTAEHVVRFLFKVLPLEPDFVILYDSYNDVVPRVFHNFSDDYYHFRRLPRPSPSLISKLYIGKIISSAYSAKFELRAGNLLQHIWRKENMPKTDKEKIENYNSTTSAVFQRNLEYIIDLALARGIGIALVTTPFQDDAPSDYDQVPKKIWVRGISEHNQVMVELAKRYDLPLCRFHDHPDLDVSIFANTVHPNARGNALLAECIANSIENEIAEGLVRIEKKHESELGR